ncbi:hypothetical protein EGW08_016511 [Elysia chlorotica]|uniref:Uncharacterized protein n=1 Tax=Elysia chlorotica TaxID=188477 RepID=A0A433T2E4_ELYCH|nr:hypothetical protein EGW08_016511 [Elysia chlorotica]
MFKKTKKGEKSTKEGSGVYQESDVDSIEVSRLELPYREPVKNVSLGSVNTVRDEIDRLLRTYDLRIPVDECELVITKTCGNSVRMNTVASIESYMNELSNCTSVRLIHCNATAEIAQAAPNIGSLGVNPRY